MLRFFERFSAFSAIFNGYAPFFDNFMSVFQLTSGWIKPLRVGGHAQFSALLPFIFIRYYSSLFSFRLRYSFALQSKTKRSSIEHLSKTYRTSIEDLSKTYRRPIEDLSKTYRRPIEDLSKTYRRPIEVIIRQ